MLKTQLVEVNHCFVKDRALKENVHKRHIAVGVHFCVEQIQKRILDDAEVEFGAEARFPENN